MDCVEPFRRACSGVAHADSKSAIQQDEILRHTSVRTPCPVWNAPGRPVSSRQSHVLLTHF